MKRVCWRTSQWRYWNINIYCWCWKKMVLHHFLQNRKYKNFESPKQIIAFAGTDPTIYQSGSSVNIRGSISKGNSHLRRTIWHMAKEQQLFGMKHSNPIMIKNEMKAKLLNNRLLLLPINSFVLFFKMLKNNTKFESNQNLAI